MYHCCLKRCNVTLVSFRDPVRNWVDEQLYIINALENMEIRSRERLMVHDDLSAWKRTDHHHSYDGIVILAVRWTISRPTSEHSKDYKRGQFGIHPYTT